MKKTKLFAMMTTILAMGLVACNGPKESKQPESKGPDSTPTSQQTSTPASTPASSQPAASTPASSTPASTPASSTPASSSQDAVEKAVTVSSFGLTKKNDKVYLTATGTATGLTAAELKFALAMQHTGAITGGDQQTGYMVGGETFGDADYAIQATLGHDGAFTIEYDLSGCAGLAQGSYFVTLGVKGVEEIATPLTHDDVELSAGGYKFYFRNDINNKLTVHVEELPPLAFTAATIEVDNDGKVWAKIGGAVAAGLAQADFDAYDTFIQFQQVGGSWSKTRLSKADGQFRWVVANGNAFLYADVSLFQAGNNYNTHLNVKYGSEANCKMEVAINQKYTVKNGNQWQDITVYSNPQASGSDQSEFWGNLGFKVAAGQDPAAHVHDFSNAAAQTDEVESSLGSCACGVTNIVWDAQKYNETASAGMSKDQAALNSDKGAKFSGDVYNKTSGTESVGAHAVYNVNVPAVQTAAKLLIKGVRTSSAVGFFSAQSNDGSPSYYQNAGGEWVKYEWRWKLLVNDVEVPFTPYTTENPEPKTVQNDYVKVAFPCTFALKQGVNKIELQKWGGYTIVFTELTLEY